MKSRLRPYPSKLNQLRNGWTPAVRRLPGKGRALPLVGVAWLVAMFSAPGHAAMLTDDLLARWSFEGSLNDTSGQNHHLSLVGATVQQPQIVGGGVGGGQALSTTNSLLNHTTWGQVAAGYAKHGTGVVNALDLTSSSAPSGYAVQVWFYHDGSFDRHQTLLNNRAPLTGSGDAGRNGWEILLGTKDLSGPNAGKSAISFGANSGSGVIAAGGWVALTPNQWHHVVFSSHLGTGHLYVDGAHVTSGNMFQGLHGSVEDLIVGATHYNGFLPEAYVNPFSGKLDEIAIWGRSLTAGEVSQLYGGGQGLNVPDHGPTLVLLLGGLAALAVRYRRRSDP